MTAEAEQRLQEAIAGERRHWHVVEVRPDDIAAALDDARDEIARLREAIALSAIPTLLVFAGENAGVREVIGALRAVLSESDR